MNVRGPLFTLAAVAALGTGILLVNEARRPAVSEPTAEPTAQLASPPAPAPASPAPQQFAAQADYVGRVPTADGLITLEISIDGNRAIAYACDGASVEVWLRGTAANGAVNLQSKDASSRLDGRLRGDEVGGLLTVGDKSWRYTAPAVVPAAGLYRYDGDGERAGWIVNSGAEVTGVLRRSDGTTVPAPELTTDATSVRNGRTVAAPRVPGDD